VELRMSWSADYVARQMLCGIFGEFAQGLWWIHGPGRVAGVYPYDIGRTRPQPKFTPCALGHCRFKCVFLLYTR
jgi:hypothetical protein